MYTVHTLHCQPRASPTETMENEFTYLLQHNNQYSSVSQEKYARGATLMRIMTECRADRGVYIRLDVTPSQISAVYCVDTLGWRNKYCVPSLMLCSCSVSWNEEGHQPGRLFSHISISLLMTFLFSSNPRTAAGRASDCFLASPLSGVTAAAGAWLWPRNCV